MDAHTKARRKNAAQGNASVAASRQRWTTLLLLGGLAAVVGSSLSLAQVVRLADRYNSGEDQVVRLAPPPADAPAWQLTSAQVEQPQRLEPLASWEAPLVVSSQPAWSAPVVEPAAQGVIGLAPAPVVLPGMPITVQPRHVEPRTEVVESQSAFVAEQQAGSPPIPAPVLSANDLSEAVSSAAHHSAGLVRLAPPPAEAVAEPVVIVDNRPRPALIGPQGLHDVVTAEPPLMRTPVPAAEEPTPRSAEPIVQIAPAPTGNRAPLELAQAPPPVSVPHEVHNELPQWNVPPTESAAPSATAVVPPAIAVATEPAQPAQEVMGPTPNAQVARDFGVQPPVSEASPAPPAVSQPPEVAWLPAPLVQHDPVVRLAKPEEQPQPDPTVFGAALNEPNFPVRLAPPPAMQEPPLRLPGNFLLVATQPDAPPSPTGEQSPHEAVPPGTGTPDTTDLSRVGTDEERFGRNPEENTAPINEQFLRQDAVLLEPGQWQFDYGLVYVWQSRVSLLANHEPGPPEVVYLDEVRNRLLIAPFAFRYGITDNIQGYANVPFGWANGELQTPFFDDFENEVNIGDVAAGLSILLQQQDECHCSDVIFTVGFLAPTGPSDFFNVNPASATLGNGFWEVNTDLTFIYEYDPAVVFWGLGYNWRLPDDAGGSRINPGDEIDYRFGLGFAINDRISVNTEFNGSFVLETEVDSLGLPGSMFEPLSVQLSTTIMLCDNLFVQPYVSWGITDDATDADFGVVFTRSGECCYR